MLHDLSHDELLQDAIWVYNTLGEKKNIKSGGNGSKPGFFSSSIINKIIYYRTNKFNLLSL